MLIAETYARLGESDRARTLLVEARRLGADAQFPTSVAWADRALGRLDAAAGAHADAERHLTTAARLFETMEARVEAERTRRELARLTRANAPE